MTDRESAAGPGDDGRASTSRRTFLRLAGSTAGVGLSATGASAAVARSGDEVRVVASEAQGETARDAAAALRETRSVADVSVRTEGASAAVDRFAAGTTDALVAGRPLLPAERSRAAENDVDPRRRDFPTAVAALRHPESSWVDPLSPADLAVTWRRDGPVETWAEVRPGSSIGGTARSAGGVGRARPARDGTVLVRGVRSHQYAVGHGGLGYYEPAEDWLVDRPAWGRDAHTSLVRLAALYVDRESLGRQPIADVVAAFAVRSEERVGRVPYYGSPFAGT